MKAIFFIPKDRYMTVRNQVETHELLSRQSLTFRDNTSLGLEKEGYYLEIGGSEEAMKVARELLKDFKELKGKDLEKIDQKIKEQEEKAQAGFGAIFG